MAAPVEEAIPNGLIPAVPCMTKVAIGVLVPIPTLPEDFTINKEDLVEDATFNKSVIAPLVPCKESKAAGVEEPIPTFPPLNMAA